LNLLRSGSVVVRAMFLRGDFELERRVSHAAANIDVDPKL